MLNEKISFFGDFRLQVQIEVNPLRTVRALAELERAEGFAGVARLPLVSPFGVSSSS